MTNVRKSLSTPLAWLLVFLHGWWFVLAIGGKPPETAAERPFRLNAWGTDEALIAGRPFHFEYEKPALKWLTVADIPSGLAAGAVGLALWPLSLAFGLDEYAYSWVGACLFFVLASLQWFFIGRKIASRVASPTAR